MYHCAICGGAIGEPGKAYGYAGKWCYCGRSSTSPFAPTSPPVLTRPEPSRFLEWLRGYLDAGGRDIARIETELRRALS